MHLDCMIQSKEGNPVLSASCDYGICGTDAPLDSAVRLLDIGVYCVQRDCREIETCERRHM